VDRDFGPKTEARVKAFQRRMVLDDDSIVGPRTWNKLGACY
jgi:peptidoglycan hydrolase-like protein with peptidoglycan-binding domain